MKKKPFYTSIIVTILILLAVGYFSGYRIDGFSITRIPVINITVPYSGSVVILDKKVYKTTKEDFQTVTIVEDRKGLRNIIVSHPDRWPWTKNLYLENDNTYDVTPFNIKHSQEVKIISSTDEEYGSKLAEIEQTPIPTKENPIVSKDTKISMYLENNTVFVKWLGTDGETPDIFCPESECSRNAVVASFIADIHSVALYPEQNDKIIISADGSVSILEIAPNGNQNFQHLIKGQDPRFILQNSTLFIADGEAIAEINLE
jgi:hypothetical protein